MRALKLQFRGSLEYPYKALDVEIEWAPCLVLFGPNDSGKTNRRAHAVLTYHRA